MILDHFILTRYNITFWDKQSETVWRNPQWLNDRLRLFFTYTFPSVAAQEIRAFKWFVFIHPDTPGWVKERLERDRAAANMHVIEVDVFDPRVASQVVRQHTGAATTHLVTTTLDNDDALARRFIGEVQSHVRAVEFELINCVEGLRLVERSGALYHCRLRSNPFISAVEQVREARTIWAYLPHSTILKRVREVRDVISEPLWLQVVHDRNLAATGAWGLLRAPANELSSRFCLGSEVHVSTQSSLQVWAENVRRWLERRVINRLGPKMRRRLKRRLRRA